MENKMVIVIRDAQGKRIIRKEEISNPLTEEVMVRAIAPFSKENVTSIKIISSAENFVVESGAFKDLRNIIKINLSKVRNLQVPYEMLTGCTSLRKVAYPRYW